MVRIYSGKIKDNVVLLQLQDDETRYFESLWEIPEGVTYNAYLILEQDTTILVDGWKHIYGEMFLEEIRKFVDLKDIEYIIVHHMEPDHSGSLKQLIPNLSSKAKVVGHPLVRDLIKSFYGFDVNFYPAASETEMKVGNSTIKFYHVSWLHWPETIASLYNNEVLFTCDAFGSFGIPSSIFFDDMPREEQERFLWYAQKYFADIIGHYIDWAAKALQKLGEVIERTKIVAPAHGPLWRNPQKIVELYKAWSSRKSVKGKLVIVYTSMYGFIKEMVSTIAGEASKFFNTIKTYKFIDVHRDLVSDVLGDLLDAEAVILATATYDADVFPYAKYLIELLIAKTPKNKKILVASNYGWGAVAGKKIASILQSAGFKVVDVIEFRSGRLLDNVERLREGVEKLAREP